MNDTFWNYATGWLWRKSWNSTHLKLNSQSHSLLSPPAILKSTPLSCVSSIPYHCSPASCAQTRVLNVKVVCPSAMSHRTQLSSCFDFPVLSTSLYFLQYLLDTSDHNHAQDPNSSHCSEDNHSHPFSHLFAICQHNLFKAGLTMPHPCWKPSGVYPLLGVLQESVSWEVPHFLVHSCRSSSCAHYASSFLKFQYNGFLSGP